MPPYPTDAEDELRKAMTRAAVLVSGTGVSISASRDPSTGKPHAEASWAGLLRNGLTWLQDHQLISQAKAKAHLSLLEPDENPDTHDFISAAHVVTRYMGGSESHHFAEWLRRTVGTIKAHRRELLDALEALRHHGHLLATTNYDDLLLDEAGLRVPVTWKETDAFIRAARNEEFDKVIFLHGYWRNPASVILDWTSYQKISRDERYRGELATVWQMTTWIYVGCGTSGLNDPDLGLLLERYGRRARNAELWDFCLVTNEQRAEFQAYFEKLGANILAVAFGADHEQLPRFLQSLLPAPSVLPVPSPPASPIISQNRGALIPKPPAFYAEPDYIGSHRFVGREAELQTLSDWAKPADPTNFLLFEAIGGNGKSMLTWQWTKHHSTAVRADWAGRFWYSFYEKGAIMADFCRRALAYMTESPLEAFAKKRTTELEKDLLLQLHARPWLVILDGLERVLVAYHRIDAAEMADEDVNSPTDKIVNRNPRDAIRDEDNDLLHALAAAAPSKILVSSRLTPRVLLNSAGQPITGTKRITLSGLRPPDAERLLRSCGVEGSSSATIQTYLTANCDNHPLVIGILGGLINHYLPARGNFDVWLDDVDGGAKLDLASLNLSERRNHILHAALQAIPPASYQLLSTLSLLSQSADYQMLKAFNPHVPPELEKIDKPAPPDEESLSACASEKEKAKLKERYETALKRWREYQEGARARLASKAFRDAPKKLSETVRDLEHRGLLQYDDRTRRHDLHPVVRAIAAGGMQPVDKEQYGQRVVDYFSSLPHEPYEQAEKIEDVQSGLNIIRTLIRMGRLRQASKAYRETIGTPLYHNLDAHSEVLSLLRPFFPGGWDVLPPEIDESDAGFLANSAGNALGSIDQDEEAVRAYESALQVYLRLEDWSNVIINIDSIALNLRRMPAAEKALRLAMALAEAAELPSEFFSSRFNWYLLLTRMGRWEEADAVWSTLEARIDNSDFPRGYVQLAHAQSFHLRGQPNWTYWSSVENLVKSSKSTIVRRFYHGGLARWQLESGEWALAAENFGEAVRLARERGIPDVVAETGLALAKCHLRRLAKPQREAQRLEALRNPAYRFLAQLWLVLGDSDKAKTHALAAYKKAWADGEPYVDRYSLTKITELLTQMHIPIPSLAPYDSAKDEPFFWQTDVLAAIDKLRATKTQKLAGKSSPR